MDPKIRRRLEKLPAPEPPPDPEELAALEALLIRHGVDPEQALSPTGQIIVGGDKHQLIAVCNALIELGGIEI